MRNVLAIIGTISIGLWLLSRLANKIVSEISVTNVGLSFGTLGPTGVDFTLPISFANNTSVSIPIESFRGSLIYGTQEVAPVLINLPSSIKANSTSTIHVDSRIQFTQVAQNILELVRSGQYLNNLRLVGVLTYKGIGIPIDQVVTIIWYEFN